MYAWARVCIQFGLGVSLNCLRAKARPTWGDQPSGVDAIHRVLLFWFYLNKQTNQQTNKVVRRREAEFLAVGMRAVRHRYDTFHWKWTSPDIQKIEKLRVFGISRYKHTTKIWSNLDFNQDSFWVAWFGRLGGWFNFSGWCERCLLMTESPKTPGHYRYLLWVLSYIP